MIRGALQTSLFWLPWGAFGHHFGGDEQMLLSLLLPILRERFPGRGLLEGISPNPCAVFPGIHPGIRSVSIYDDGDELTVSVDELTHDHFCEYDHALSKPERERRIVDSVVEFLDALFADQVAVWGQHDVGGGWYRIDLGDAGGGSGVAEFVWSGPRGASAQLTIDQKNRI